MFSSSSPSEASLRDETEAKCRQLGLDSLRLLVTRPESDQAAKCWSALQAFLEEIERLEHRGFEWTTFRELSEAFYMGAYKYWSKDGGRPSIEQINHAALQLAGFFKRVAIAGGEPPSLEVTHCQLGGRMDLDRCSAAGGFPLGPDYQRKGKLREITPLGFRVQGSRGRDSKATVLDYFYRDYFTAES
jgi:hypothetical protein